MSLSQQNLTKPTIRQLEVSIKTSEEKGLKVLINLMRALNSSEMLGRLQTWKREENLPATGKKMLFHLKALSNSDSSQIELCILLNMVKDTNSTHCHSSHPPKLWVLLCCFPGIHGTLPFNQTFSLMVKTLTTHPQNKTVYVAEYLHRPGIHWKKNKINLVVFHRPPQNIPKFCRKGKPSWEILLARS